MATTQLSNIVYCVVDMLWNLILWEKLEYSSESYDKVNIICSILDKTKDSYVFATGMQVFYDGRKIPTGFVFGRSFILHIKSVVVTQNNKSVNKLTIGLYGWWTIRNLNVSEPESEFEPESKENDIQTVTSYSATGYLSRATETHLPHTYHANSIALASYLRDMWRQSPLKNLVVFIYGDQGTGKTKSGIYLSKLIGGIVYKDFVVAVDRQRIQSAINEVFDNVQSNTNVPLVLIWDEIDDYLFPVVNGILELVHIQGSTPRCKISKPTWNSFLDYMSTKRNVILIITSNRDKKVFDDYDKSLLRQHRINAVFECRDNGFNEVPWSSPDDIVAVELPPIKPIPTPTASTSKNEMWTYFGGAGNL